MITKPIKDITSINTIKKYFKTQNRHRELLFFLLAINTGLNCSEIISLNIKDVLNKDYIVSKNKNNDNIYYLINPEIKKLINHISKNKNENEPLFISAYNKRIDRTIVFRWFQSAFRTIGIDSEYSIASFRKTFGYQYYQKTKDLTYLQWVFNMPSIKRVMNFIDIDEDMNLRFVPIGL